MDLSEYDDYLKEFYLPAAREQFLKQTILLDSKVITRDSENVSGKTAYIAIEGLSFAGVGARADGSATLPTPVKGKYGRIGVGMSYQYAAMEITGPTLAASRNDRGAFESAMTSETSTKLRAFNMDINRQLFDDGNGILCLVDGTPDLATGVITIDAAWGLANDTNGDKFLSDGCRLDIYSPSGTKRGTCQVTALTEGSGSSTSATITVDAVPDGTADGDYIYRELGYGNEMAGLRSFASTTSTLFGVSPTNFRDWKAVVKTGATAGTNQPLTQFRMEQVRSDMFHKRGRKCKFLIAGPGVVMTFADIASRGGIMVNKAKVGMTDWEGPDWGGRAIIEDSFCHPNRMYFIDPDPFDIFQMNEPDWLMGHGSSILYRYADIYRADYGWYCIPALSVRGACGVLQDITELS